MISLEFIAGVGDIVTLILQPQKKCITKLYEKLKALENQLFDVDVVDPNRDAEEEEEGESIYQAS